MILEYNRYASIRALITHLKKEHDFAVQTETYNFNNLDEFQQWKSEEEMKRKSYYVQHSSSIPCGAQQVWYLYCNRSGWYHAKGKGKRQLKSQGSCKVDNACISHMKVTEDSVTGNVSVEYCCTHNSHSINIAHIPVPEGVKLDIAAKLHQGVKIDRILDDLRDSLSANGTIGPEQLLSKQHIQNMKRQLNLQSIIKHQNDFDSTSAWVEELKTKEYNPVIVFKPQGMEQTTSMDNLGKDDFLLAIQSEFQKDALQHYGNKVIMMDATHDTTQYKFLLITILVVDDHGAGLPVAWAISNREDAALLMQFLSAVKERVGSLQPKYFMSDCAEQYFSAWLGIFGRNNTQKMLCIWHVDRAWRKALQTHVTNQQERVEIYHQLCILLQERDKTSFLVKLQQLMSYLKETQGQFFQYFNTHYVPHQNEWATCYRIGTIVNTNMFVESFHRLLKVVYLDSKQNRRVDSLLFVLLRLSRNLIYDQIQKIAKGKITHRKCEIKKRHKSAEEFMGKKTPKYTKQGENTWKIESFSHEGNFYTVQQLLPHCECPLHCSMCNACIHMYSCTCLDASIHCTVCKHIHVLHMLESISDTMKSSNDDNETSGIEVEDEFNTLDYFARILHEGNATTLENLRKEVNGLLHGAELLVDTCKNADTLQTVKKHLKSAIAVIRATGTADTYSWKPRSIMAPNAKHSKQLTFFSTQRKRKTSNSRLAKPTSEEEEKCVKRMRNMDIKVCGICWKEEDMLSLEEIHWIACENCGLWLHLSCCDGSSNNEDGFICKNCQQF